MYMSYRCDIKAMWGIKGLVCLILSASFLFSQDIFSSDYGNSSQYSRRRHELLEKQMGSGDQGYDYETISPEYLDKRIDPGEYVLGPGDQLSVFIWSTVNESFTSTIGFEGNVVIPKVGVISVGEKTLEEGRAMLTDSLSTTYRGADISVLLSNIRQFKVYVLGKVNKPGAYQVNAATRVSDVIEQAGGCTGGRRIRRRIEIQGRDSVPAVDLPLFYHAGVREKNPYVREGDRIYVHARYHYLSINGAVQYPGRYDFIKGDTLGTLLDVAGGLARGADTTRMTLTRFVNGDATGDSTHTMSIALPEARHMPLQKDDRVHVYSIPEYRMERTVVLTGEVQYPGRYPIKKDETRLLEVIDMAGGFTDEAFLEGASVDRRVFRDFSVQDVNTLLEVLQVTQIDPTYVDPDDLSYIKSKIMESEGKMSIDLFELVHNKEDAYNIVLRDQDSIHVPRVSLNVKVTGAVVNPGLVKYKKGAGHLYYVQKAGGFLKDSRKRGIKVGKVRTGKGVWLDPSQVKTISPGDVVYVPEVIQRDRVVIVKDYLSIISSITTIGMTIYTLFGK
jgi:protein involved in polysaccharide export with SLBB domain